MATTSSRPIRSIFYHLRGNEIVEGRFVFKTRSRPHSSHPAAYAASSAEAKAPFSQRNSNYRWLAPR